jgi:hypothetical protein
VHYVLAVVHAAWDPGQGSAKNNLN